MLEVVRVYKEAQDNGQPPTKAVREHFGVSKERAARWVWLCRKNSLLPATKRVTLVVVTRLTPTTRVGS